MLESCYCSNCFYKQKSYQNKNCCSCCDEKSNNNCKKRNFRDRVPYLLKLLSEIKQKEFGDPIEPTYENAEEKKYKKYNYNASFHKGLIHNLVDGRLVSNLDYEKMRYAIIKGDQPLLESIPMANETSFKLANPLASLSSVLIGVMQGQLRLDDAPFLSSSSGAAEMVEIYAHVYARDVGFSTYDSNPKIAHLLNKTDLNNIFVLSNLKYSPSGPNKPFTPSTIFRGNNYGDLYGPYISQLLLLNIVEGALRIPQKYFSPPTRDQALAEGFRVEWGVDLSETIGFQNGILSPLVTPPNKLTARYINSGRTLAEAVHNDGIYQFYYQAARILGSLGAQPNAGWAVYPNQGSFITNNGIALLQTAIAEVSGIALQHGWYWKWQHSRKLRPDTFALWAHDIKTGLVPNENNFDIAEFLLNNHTLIDTYNINNEWVPGSNSYTLPQTYREGSPIHPSYISGHAIIAGAAAAILKIFFNGEQSWRTLPGVISGAFSGFPNGIVQANSDGSALETFNGDISDLTVGGEINKLASNVSIGRDWAGIHYRSDAMKGMELGEEIAISYMEDMLSTMVENNSNGTVPEIIFRRFNGGFTTIRATVCTNSASL